MIENIFPQSKYLVYYDEMMSYLVYFLGKFLKGISKS